jgi:hypothetical protein
MVDVLQSQQGVMETFKFELLVKRLASLKRMFLAQISPSF